ncbi:MAG: hypothetical protein IPN69_09165 [Acidobacteria bacterium]|nr:hypothetical protein [Acidobacteriota bacterium]
MMLFVLLMTIGAAAWAKEPVWLREIKTIVPFKSTRDDVVRRFGQPSWSADPHFNEYILQRGTLSVFYSRGLCSQNPKAQFDVPEFVVVTIEFELKKPRKPKHLGINLTGLEASHPFDGPKATFYSNKNPGITYFVNSRGLLESVSFHISSGSDVRACKREDARTEREIIRETWRNDSTTVRASCTSDVTR